MSFTKELYGLILKENEKERLYEICVKYNIKIPYPDLFINDTHYLLWAIANNSIGLIGTFIMHKKKENGGVIFTSLNEFEKHLQSQINKI